LKELSSFVLPLCGRMEVLMGVEGIGQMNSNVNTSQTAQTNKSSDLSINDFFTLIAAQLQNQSMYDTVDNTQFISQLAQFTSLSQMSEMTSSSNSNLAVSLLGKSVCVTTTDDLGQTKTAVGNVEQISYNKGVPYLLVNGAYHMLSEITDIGSVPAEATDQTTSAETEEL
jgi:flagellar basal-body rod modification protein FlgD